MAFNLEDYETVESRLEKWHKAFPDGRIETDIVEHTQSRFIVVCKLFKSQDTEKPFSSGVASEVIADRGVNATSALENCETSAIGRALANAGFATKGKRASKEEMTKVVKGEAQMLKPLYGRPNSRSAAMEMALRNDIANHPWQAPVLNEPAPVAWSVNDVASALNAEPIGESFNCKHGSMIKKIGESKATKKPYYGFVCAVNEKSEQCEPKWAKITANGKWYFDEPDKDK